MVGFDDVLVQLLDKLTGFPSSRQVIPIEGMGGIGKTTLARNAFEHPLIVQRFDVRLWATISQQYSVDQILTQLVSGLRKSISETVDEYSTSRGTVGDELEELYKSLYGRRYLIVLDDMWSVEAWGEIGYLFPDTDDGSRIVVTTRLSNVADHLSISWLEVLCLDEDSSWDLFCQEAFAEQGCPPELVEIGKKIVEKCKGLPLAIVVVAGHLRNSSMALQYWENVASHINSILNSTEKDEQCMNVLALSYTYLPAHLKPCFLLLGMFPEDEVIYAFKIVQLWIAEGIVQPLENTRLEVVAEDYLWDLLKRNLILIDALAGDGKIYTFRLHDLVRELCLKMSKKEEFLYAFDTPPPPTSRERRVVISGEVVAEVNNITTTFDFPIHCLMRKRDMKLLRTVNKVFVTSSTSESIFHQLNLRFLTIDLDYKTPPTLYLPSSISLLWNLQILVTILPNQSIMIAPYEIWEMLQLRHLVVDPVCLVDPLPVDRLDQTNGYVLRNLHTLGVVKNFRLSEEVCKRIPNIRDLRLSYCDYCDDAISYYCPHNLGNFHELERLTCKFDGNPKWRDFASRLTFPSSLKTLCLGGCGVDWKELTTMVGSLPHLVCLILLPHSVIGSEWTPVEGKFLRLEALKIWGCDDLVYWNADRHHFPVLESLHLKSLSKLDEFPPGIGEIPALRLIKLKYCSISSTISAMRTLEKREEEQGSEDLRLFISFRGDDDTLESFMEKAVEEDFRSKNIYMRVKPESSK